MKTLYFACSAHLFTPLIPFTFISKSMIISCGAKDPNIYEEVGVRRCGVWGWEGRSEGGAARVAGSTDGSGSDLTSVLRIGWACSLALHALQTMYLHLCHQSTHQTQPLHKPPHASFKRRAWNEQVSADWPTILHFDRLHDSPHSLCPFGHQPYTVLGVPNARMS